MPRKIEISHKTIIFTFFFMACVWFLIQIRDILYLLFISFILMTAIRPLVGRLSRFRIPQPISILIIYVLIFGVFGASLAGAVPALIQQSTRLLTELPEVAAQIVPYWQIDAAVVTEQIAPLSENVIRFTLNIFNNALSTLTILVITFYLLTGRKSARHFLTETIGSEVADKIIDVLRRVEDKIGAWVRGQIILMGIVGVMVYVGLLVLRVEFALPLAIIAGALEILPLIGPIISAVPAILVAFTVSPLLGFSVAALYFLVQQIENSVIVPQVMKKSVGYSPLLTIVSLMIGGRLAGVLGAVLAIPVTLTLQVIVSYFLFDAENRQHATVKHKKTHE